MAESRAHRITPKSRPDGADLEIEGFVADILGDLLTLLREQPALMDDLCAVVDGPVRTPDPFRPEDELPVEQLIADLMDRLPTSIRIHRGPLTVLHEHVGRILDPQQRTTPRAALKAVPQHDGRRTA